MCKLACMRRCGKPVCRLWERACPFPWAVNGFSIGKAAVFHISMTQNLLSHDQAVCGDRHIAHGYQKPPCQDETADHAAEDEIQSEQRDPAAEGTAARHDPEAHPMEAEGQAAEYPEPHIIQLAALHAGGFENSVQQQGRRHGQHAFYEKCFDRFTSCHKPKPPSMPPLYKRPGAEPRAFEKSFANNLRTGPFKASCPPCIPDILCGLPP